MNENNFVKVEHPREKTEGLWFRVGVLDNIQHAEKIIKRRLIKLGTYGDDCSMGFITETGYWLFTITGEGLHPDDIVNGIEKAVQSTIREMFPELKDKPKFSFMEKLMGWAEKLSFPDEPPAIQVKKEEVNPETEQGETAGEIIDKIKTD